MVRAALCLLLLAIPFAPALAQYGEARIRCESRDGRDNFCAADTRGGVALVDQLSRTACVEGSTWGWDRRGVWVRGGCRGEFALGRGGYGPGHHGEVERVRCESRDHRRNFCRVDTRGGVVLVDQLSRAACVRGRSWDWDRGGIWVSEGCRGEFVVGAGARGPRGPDMRGPMGQIVSCSSDDNRYNYCRVPVRRNVELTRQLSRSECVFRRSWGFDRGGIWVDHGCRGEFQVY